MSRALGVPMDQAEALKTGQEVESTVSPEDARRVAHGRASSFVDEIRSSLEFYSAQTPGARVTRVLVTGGGSKLEGFPELLEERLAIPVERGRPLEKVEPGTDVADGAEALLAVAVGLAMAGGEQ